MAWSQVSHRTHPNYQYSRVPTSVRYLPTGYPEYFETFPRLSTRFASLSMEGSEVTPTEGREAMDRDDQPQEHTMIKTEV